MLKYKLKWAKEGEREAHACCLCVEVCERFVEGSMEPGIYRSGA